MTKATSVPPICDAPKLVISKRIRNTAKVHNPLFEYQFQYLDKHHGGLPHIVKFSGGRSSGMLLLTLLANNILRPERGDIVLFNNTSSEHPRTYNFVRECKSVTEQHGIPFFLTEFQTYEDARKGEWTRLPSYRLVNDQPYSEDNLHGFRWKGEVFEELMSWTGFVPNQFRRVCTINMKLLTTRMFLKDWLASKSSISRLGHWGGSSRIDGKAMHSRHVRNGGQVPKEIYIAKRRYAWNQPFVRPEQHYRDYSPVWIPINNEWVRDRVRGDFAEFGDGGVEYVALMGLRADEPARIGRVKERNSNPKESGYDGEHVYMPLDDMQVAASDVNDFWDRQQWNLSLPPDSGLSNCVYCFLKGSATLRKVHREMSSVLKNNNLPGFGDLKNTPSDIAWWQRMEKEYGRDLVAEEREVRSNHDFLGFFGAGNRFTYELIANAEESEVSTFDDNMLPCDCTD